MTKKKRKEKKRKTKNSKILLLVEDWEVSSDYYSA
jgi:hypothetical protein